MVPRELREVWTPGRYVAGEAPIGEIRCEGLRPGRATLWARVRVRLLTALRSDEAECHCGNNWDVALRVLIEGQEARSINGPIGDGHDGSCRKGPDVMQEIPVMVGADGRLRARVELRQCERGGATACVFLRGTRFDVVQ